MLLYRLYVPVALVYGIEIKRSMPEDSILTRLTVSQWGIIGGGFILLVCRIFPLSAIEKALFDHPFNREFQLSTDLRKQLFCT